MPPFFFKRKESVALHYGFEQLSVGFLFRRQPTGIVPGFPAEIIKACAHIQFVSFHIRNAKLPAPPKSMSERMEELKKKYPKEMAEYEELQKTDRRAAFAKLRTLLEKEGVSFGPQGRNQQAGMRDNPN